MQKVNNRTRILIKSWNNKWNIFFTNLTFTAPSSGEYTFEITSDFDTYLYVIDPTSSTTITINTNYNDDSGEGLNSKLTTSLKTDIPYLVIYSGYNLSNSSHTGNLTLKITKE